MVGSSALSTQLDPEEHREVVSTFQSLCASEVKRFGGMVAQYLGDGLTEMARRSRRHFGGVRDDQ